MMRVKNKFIAILLAVMVAVAWCVPAFADDAGPAADSGTGNESAVEETKPAEQEKPAETTQPKGDSSTESTSQKIETPAAPGEESTVQNSDSGSGAKAKSATGGHSTYHAVDNATTLADGTYENCDVSIVDGGTGKVDFFCDKVIISGGKAKAVIRTSSQKYTHFFTGTVDDQNNGDDKNIDLYNAETGAIGQGVYKTTVGSNGAFATIPVSIGSNMYLSGRTTAMSSAHWITYTIKVSADESNYAGEAGIQDGTYKPDSFTFTGGTNKAHFYCERVIVVNGKATAVFTTDSDYMTHVYMGQAPSNNENPELYDPVTKKKGAGVYTIGNKQVSVPVALNEEKPFSGRTTVMSEPHWINYNYKLTLTPDSEKISDSTDIPPNPDEGTEPVDPTPVDPTPVDPTPVNPQKLSVGTWKVKATTCRVMFYLQPKNTDPAWTILRVNKDNSMTATIVLNGSGYDYVYMGTPAQARSAGKNNWIKAKIVNGYYTFDIPVSELDKKLPIAIHSWKYENDGDPRTDPWRPDKWIMFYSSGAQKIKDDSSLVPSTPNKNGPRKDTKWKDAKNKGTSKVDNSTSLKDGTYKPSKVRWSGGSGRLAYIHCTKVTVKNGKAYATIVFASSKYDKLRANGTVYSKRGGGNSTFVIPIKLNANNTIIGRTTAMSQPHWIEYKIFVYIPGATGKDGKDGAEGGLIDTTKLPDKAPELIGLENEGETKIEHAKLFRIFKYEQGITLIAIDQASGTALYKKPKKDADKEAKADDVNDDSIIEYDEDGKPIAKSENEFTNELYQNNVVYYLVVPEGMEVPAGMEKDCIIVQKPVENAFAFSDEASEIISEIGKGDVLEKMDDVGTYEKPDFKKIVLEEGDLVILPSEALPEKVTKKSTDEEAEASKEKTKTLHTLQMRYSSLSVPVLVDRSMNEKAEYGDAEWIKVYGAIYGEEEAAAQLFDQLSKGSKKEKTNDEQENDE